MYLEISELNVSYGEIQVLWDINLSAKKNESISLIGANGAGKSTLLNCISGIIRQKSGSIVVDGVNITNMPVMQRVSEMRIMQVPEGRKLFSGMTVQENVEMGAYQIKGKNRIKDSLEWVYHLFPELSKRAMSLAGHLSGGEQQMVAIGRALMGEPRLLLIDEMSLGLAPIVVDRIVLAIDEIQKANRMGIILVEQDVALGLKISESAFVLDTGRITKQGPSCVLIDDKDVRAAYLGL